MSTQGTARAAVLLHLALVVAGCAAERLEARDPDRGPTGAASPTTPIVRPTVLQATEKQLAPGKQDEPPAEHHHETQPAKPPAHQHEPQPPQPQPPTHPQEPKVQPTHQRDPKAQPPTHQHEPKVQPPTGKALYVCPMHPEVQSNEPGECPKCGMKLVRKERSP